MVGKYVDIYRESVEAHIDFYVDIPYFMSRLCRQFLSTYVHRMCRHMSAASSHGVSSWFDVEERLGRVALVPNLDRPVSA